MDSKEKSHSTLAMELISLLELNKGISTDRSNGCKKNNSNYYRIATTRDLNH